MLCVTMKLLTRLPKKNLRAQLKHEWANYIERNDEETY